MKRTVLAAVACLAVAMPAFAAEKGNTTLSLMPGYAIPVSGRWAKDSYLASGTIDADAGHKASFALAVAGDYKMSDMLAVGLEAGYNFKHALKTIPAGASNGEEKVFYATPYVKLEKAMDKFSPYAVLGAGLYNCKSADYTDESGTVWAGKNKSYLGFNLGGGVMYEVAPQVGLGIDVRWHHVFSNKQDVRGNRMSMNNIVPSLKMSYTF